MVDDPPPAERASKLQPTKLLFPLVRPRLVPRPRLVGRLQAGLQGPLTLISAPAGFGKTTLLGEWRAGAGRDWPVAWLSLDAGDNDPLRFLLYLAAALESAQADLTGHTLALLQSRQTPVVDVVLNLLAYELSGCPRDVALVLDDYHEITNLELHQGLEFLLAHLPPAVHLVLLTRADPPLPLARLRARNQLIEIRAADLRFTAEETAAFLNDVMGLGLSPGNVAALERRTEGWAAGLQLAALSLRGREDPSAFVATFSGSHHYIVDYLVEEVLDRQPEAVRSFLLQTAILDRLSGPLCDTLTGRSDGQAVLEQLEQGNLFLTPLDDQRRWYRYHPLFADVLRNRLRQADAGALPELLHRAAAWFEENDLLYEALNHALALPDPGRAARLLSDHWLQLTQECSLSTFARWIESFPAEVIQDHPRLGLIYAWTLWELGHPDAVGRYIEGAEQALTRQLAAGQARRDDPRVRVLQAEITAWRATIAASKGDLPAALDLSCQSLAMAPEGASVARGLALAKLFDAYSEMGWLEKAAHACADALAEARAAGNPGPVASTAFNLGQLFVVQGLLHRAAEVYQEGLRYAQHRGQVQMLAYGMVHLGLSDVLYEWNDLDAAGRHIELGLELSQQAGRPVETQAGQIYQARLRRARGDPQGALGQLDQAARMAQQAEVSVFQEDLSFWRARLYAELGDPWPATAWLDGTRLHVGERLGYEGGVRALRAARLQLLVGQLDEAVDILEDIVRAAAASGAQGWQIKGLVLQAAAWHRKGHGAPALEALEEALVLAAPEGYVRTFLDEGAGLLDLLRQAGRRGRAKGDAARLLAAAAPPGPPAAAAARFLVEKLSAREMEVLRLLAAGKSNREIADALVLAEGTVKKHLSNIFGKLGVRNRTACVARARELGLL
jgi:LuxR family maltose regulon positive regulatory protein